jgi:hypothetical protein
MLKVYKNDLHDNIYCKLLVTFSLLQGNVSAQSGCSSQESKEKTLTGIPSSLPKAPSMWRPPIGQDNATKRTAGTIHQSKIPQWMRFDRPMVNTTGKKHTEKSTRTSVEPREKSVASQISCNHFSPETCSKDQDTAIGKSKDISLTGKSTTVSVEVKEPAVTQVRCNLVSSKACDPADVPVTLVKFSNALPTDDNPMQNQYKNSSRVLVKAEKSHAIQHTSNSIVIEAGSSKNKSAVVCKSDNVGSNVTTNGAKHMEEENIICQGGEETVTLLTQNSILSETCSLMDIDVVISKSYDVDSKIDSHGKKRTLYSNTVCEGQKGEAVVNPSTCNHIPPETCSSKEKHTTRHNPNVNGPAQSEIAKVSVSPLQTQRCKTDFSPCKDKPVEKRFKLDSGSSLTIREKEFFEHEQPKTSKV